MLILSCKINQISKGGEGSKHALLVHGLERRQSCTDKWGRCQSCTDKWEQMAIKAKTVRRHIDIAAEVCLCLRAVYIFWTFYVYSLHVVIQFTPSSIKDMYCFIIVFVRQAKNHFKAGYMYGKVKYTLPPILNAVPQLNDTRAKKVVYCVYLLAVGALLILYSFPFFQVMIDCQYSLYYFVLCHENF